MKITSITYDPKDNLDLPIKKCFLGNVLSIGLSDEFSYSILLEDKLPLLKKYSLYVETFRTSLIDSKGPSYFLISPPCMTDEDIIYIRHTGNLLNVIKQSPSKPSVLKQFSELRQLPTEYTLPEGSFTETTYSVEGSEKIYLSYQFDNDSEYTYILSLSSGKFNKIKTPTTAETPLNPSFIFQKKEYFKTKNQNTASMVNATKLENNQAQNHTIRPETLGDSRESNITDNQTELNINEKKNIPPSKLSDIKNFSHRDLDAGSIICPKENNSLAIVNLNYCYRLYGADSNQRIFTQIKRQSLDSYLKQGNIWETFIDIKPISIKDGIDYNIEHYEFSPNQSKVLLSLANANFNRKKIFEYDIETKKIETFGFNFQQDDKHLIHQAFWAGDDGVVLIYKEMSDETPKNPLSLDKTNRKDQPNTEEDSLKSFSKKMYLYTRKIGLDNVQRKCSYLVLDNIAGPIEYSSNKSQALIKHFEWKNKSVQFSTLNFESHSLTPIPAINNILTCTTEGVKGDFIFTIDTPWGIYQKNSVLRFNIDSYIIKKRIDIICLRTFAEEDIINTIQCEGSKLIIISGQEDANKITIIDLNNNTIQPFSIPSEHVCTHHTLDKTGKNFIFSLQSNNSAHIYHIDLESFKTTILESFALQSSQGSLSFSPWSSQSAESDNTTESEQSISSNSVLRKEDLIRIKINNNEIDIESDSDSEDDSTPRERAASLSPLMFGPPTSYSANIPIINNYTNNKRNTPS